MDREVLVDRISSALSSAPEVRLAYLFGSQATGETGPMSDVDVGILFDEHVDANLAGVQNAHLLAQAMNSERIDVVSLNRAPVKLAYAIISQGSESPFRHASS